MKLILVVIKIAIE